MTRKIYRTAQGKMVDLGALQLQNENVRAVGNMGVNARGDLLDSGNRPIDTRGNQVTKQYNRQTVTPSQTATSQRNQKIAPKVDIPEPPEDFQDDFVKESVPSVPSAPETTVSSGSGGLAAAIAKARQIKQEPMKTPRELAQEQSGVRKI